MTDQPYNVLFLCTGNSARSIFAESLINRLGRGRFRGYSAGSKPLGTVEPLALAVLRRHDYPTVGLRSKDWSEFVQPDAPVMDFVFTVGLRTDTDPCPAWPGQPLAAHWGLADPAAAGGREVERLLVFRHVFRELEHRIERFMTLPLDALDRSTLPRRLNEIGQAHFSETPRYHRSGVSRRRSVAR